MTSSSRERYRDPAYAASRSWPFAAPSEAEAGDVDAQLYMAFFEFNRGSESAAYAWYTRAAEQGNTHAMQNLYRMSEQGMGTEQSAETACYWLERVIQQDDLETEEKRSALYGYACYLIGGKTPKNGGRQVKLPEDKINPEKGTRMYERAVEECRCVESACVLGNFYLTRQHPRIPFNASKGVYYFAKGAEFGRAKCAFQLHGLYKSGLVPADPELADKWLELAVKMGNEEAKHQVSSSLPKMKTPSRRAARKDLRDIERMEGRYANMMEENLSKDCSNPDCHKEEDPKGKQRFPRCSKCKFAKYCSRDCQVAHFRKGHKEECAQRLAAIEDLKEFNRNLIAPVVMCYNPQCQNMERKGQVRFKYCSRCLYAKYCSQDCQVAHYKAGHKQECLMKVDYHAQVDRLLEKYS